MKWPLMLPLRLWVDASKDFIPEHLHEWAFPPHGDWEGGGVVCKFVCYVSVMLFF